MSTDRPTVPDTPGVCWDVWLLVLGCVLGNVLGYVLGYALGVCRVYATYVLGCVLGCVATLGCVLRYGL